MYNTRLITCTVIQLHATCFCRCTDYQDGQHHVTGDVISWTTSYTSETNLSSNVYTNSDLQGNRCQDDRRPNMTVLQVTTRALYTYYWFNLYDAIGGYFTPQTHFLSCCSETA